MTSIAQFCQERGIAKSIRDAFETYCRSTYAARFSMSDKGDTVKLIVSKMTMKQVEDAWQDFVREFKQTLS
jgi:hypothetical protein